MFLKWRATKETNSSDLLHNKPLSKSTTSTLPCRFCVFLTHSLMYNGTRAHSSLWGTRKPQWVGDREHSARARYYRDSWPKVCKEQKQSFASSALACLLRSKPHYIAWCFLPDKCACHSPHLPLSVSSLPLIIENYWESLSRHVKAHTFKLQNGWSLTSMWRKNVGFNCIVTWSFNAHTTTPVE